MKPKSPPKYYTYLICCLALGFLLCLPTDSEAQRMRHKAAGARAKAPSSSRQMSRPSSGNRSASRSSQSRKAATSKASSVAQNRNVSKQTINGGAQKVSAKRPEAVSKAKSVSTNNSTNRNNKVNNIKEGRAAGSTSCNQYNCTYELLPNNHIRITPGMVSLRSCENMEIEQQYNQMLPMVDNYIISENLLTLRDPENKPLAKFIPAEGGE